MFHSKAYPYPVDALVAIPWPSPFPFIIKSQIKATSRLLEIVLKCRKVNKALLDMGIYSGHFFPPLPAPQVVIWHIFHIAGCKEEWNNAALLAWCHQGIFSTLPGQKAVPAALLLQSCKERWKKTEDLGCDNFLKKALIPVLWFMFRVFQINAFLKPQFSGWGK